MARRRIDNNLSRDCDPESECRSRQRTVEAARAAKQATERSRSTKPCWEERDNCDPETKCRSQLRPKSQTTKAAKQAAEQPRGAKTDWEERDNRDPETKCKSLLRPRSRQREVAAAKAAKQAEERSSSDWVERKIEGRSRNLHRCGVAETEKTQSDNERRSRNKDYCVPETDKTQKPAK